MSSNSLERRLHRDTMLKVVGTTVTLLALLVLGVWTLPASHDQGGLTGTWRFTVCLQGS